ncbi:MAG: NADH-ubiquinone oxidoreductase-F iron-sulfur binding region domain-containing protein [Thermoleophilia bacterium]|jgi:NADH-quinone oxidoreductase subunit F
MLGLIKGMHATISHLLTKKVTVQYPEERRQLPERSRGLLRMRLKNDAVEPRCISCTLCEQICPSVAIRIAYDYKQADNVWKLDAGAGTMLSYFNRGEQAVVIEKWPGGNGAANIKSGDSCLAGSFIDSERLTPLALSGVAGRTGVWLSQIFGVATFYDSLGPGTPSLEPAPDVPQHWSTVEGCPSILLANHGVTDPDSIDAYSGTGGYQAISKSLTQMSPEEVVEEITISGLRGRGGGGYATGGKWKLCSDADAAQKYVICNAEEGDPGSFKDRSILENNPHAVIEGMIIAGYAAGASQGIIYINAGNSLALARTRRAVDQARDRGLLDDEIPGTGFTFSIRVNAIPGAFIGGEETAAIATLEGKRPMPKVRPPWPAAGQGLHGMPTLVENVETLATAPWIINNGARAFGKIGAPHAPGTKLFSLTGAVGKPGLYEAPLDITLKKLVEDEAGGFAGDIKGALVGSTGGGFLSPGLFDIPLDYDSLAETGGDLSSGAIELLGNDTCIVDRVRECLAFSVAQSCGKCVPCRLGTRRLLDIMDRFCDGDSSEIDLDLAADLALDIQAGALCGLGRGSVRPLLTGLKFYKEEFTSHTGRDRSCAAGKCAAK